MTSASASENAYQCDLCKRSIRVPANRAGLDVIDHCIITEGCVGELHLITTTGGKNAVPSIPTEIPGLTDWFPRKILYTYNQTIARRTWTIQHNLGTRPVVQVVVNRSGVNNQQTGVELAPDDYTVTIVDLNNILLTFNRPESGTAQCIGAASSNLVNPQPIKTIDTVQQITLTANGELTLAVADISIPIPITLTFLTSTGSIVIPYTITSLSANSPWESTTEVFVVGKRLSVVSFNIVTDAGVMSSKFIDGSITSGDLVTVTFDNIAQQKPNYILLAKSPYNFVDRITDQIVDVSNLSDFDTTFFYKPNSIVASSTDIKSIYPPIVIVD